MQSDRTEPQVATEAAEVSLDPSPAISLRSPSSKRGGRVVRAVGVWLRSHWFDVFKVSLTVIGLCVAVRAIDKNTESNLVAVRGQLFEYDSRLWRQEAQSPKLAVLWVRLPNGLTPREWLEEHLARTCKDPEVLRIQHARSLYNSSFGHAAYPPIIDRLTRSRNPEPATQQVEARNDLVELYYHTTDFLYFMQHVYDYSNDGTLGPGEWESWNGALRELGPHPMLLAAMWCAHEHGYLSRGFADYVRTTYCPSDDELAEVSSPAERKRRLFWREVVKEFYPEMLEDTWPNCFPEYGNGGVRKE